MIEIRCGDSVECGCSQSGAVVCTLAVTGREYARLAAIAETLNALAGETPSYGCEADNTPATVFAGFFASSGGMELVEDRSDWIAQDVAYSGWNEGAEGKAVAERLSEALKRADEAFAKSE